MNLHLPGRGRAPQHAFRDTNPALPCPCPAHVFFSSQLTPSQKHREQRQLYIIVLWASARTFVFPSHPSCRDLVGQNHAWSLPSQMHLHKHCTGAPWARLGRAARRTAEKKRCSHHHTMSRLLEEPEEALDSGTGHGGKLTRQQDEMPKALVTGNSEPVTYSCNVSRAPIVMGKIMRGCSQKPKPYKRQQKERGAQEASLCAAG